MVRRLVTRFEKYQNETERRLPAVATCSVRRYARR